MKAAALTPVVLCLALLPACAGFITPAAHDSFLASPFRTLAPEVEPVQPPRLKRTRLPAMARISRYELPTDKLALEKVAAGERRAAPDLQPAALVEGTLRQRGMRFGTDGSVDSLYAYMRREQTMVAPTTARPGDVVFFRVHGPECGDHAGVVEAVDRGGRITFKEVRGGSLRVSYAHPEDRSTRRGTDGRILNTFLRPRLTSDPPTARYYAGEMLCAVGRVRR